jgi:hypothetical protein
MVAVERSVEMGHYLGILFYSDRLVFRLCRHLALFVGMNLLFSWVILMRDADEWPVTGVITSVFLNSFFFFGYAYITAYLLVPWLLSAKRYLLFALIFLVTGILFSFLKFCLSDYLFYSVISGDPVLKPGLTDISGLIVNTKDMTFIVALFLIGKYAKDNYGLNRRLTELQEHQMRAEIRLLKNQMDPHVVFNNLNNLYCLSLKGSVSVVPTLTRLKSLLNYYFNQGNSLSIPLSAEADAVEDFIHLEKLRFDKGMDVRFIKKGDLSDWVIPPFIFFPVVVSFFEREAVRYSGISWIHILLSASPDQFLFSISGRKPENRTGTFIMSEQLNADDLSRRFDLLYPGRTRVCVNENQGQILIKCNRKE